MKPGAFPNMKSNLKNNICLNSLINNSFTVTR